MGVTYRAVHPKLKKDVALKVIRTEKQLDEVARQRFELEAQAAAQIEQLHVAAIYHFGEEDSTLFYAMEFVQGVSLEALLELKPGPWAPVEALAMAAQTVAALKAAHKSGVIHRDLKPDNIMVIEGDALQDDNERIVAAGNRLLKVIDFGLARRLGEASASQSSLATRGFVGTPTYSSPEQCREEKTIDGRTDLYSLGIILWRLLTGKVPFDGRLHEVIIKQLGEDPQWAQMRGVPDFVQQIVCDLLAKNPADRKPQTAAELMVILDQAWRALAAGNSSQWAAPEPQWTEEMRGANEVDEGAPSGSSQEVAAGFEYLDGVDAGDAEDASTENSLPVDSQMEELHSEGMETIPVAKPKIPTALPAGAGRKWAWMGAAAGIGAVALAGWWLSQKTAGPVQAKAHLAAPEKVSSSTVLKVANGANASVEHPLVNSLGMEFLPVPGTKTLMCRTDTRVRDFREFAEATKLHQTGGAGVVQPKEVDGKPVLSMGYDPKADWTTPGFEQTAEDPVVSVSWAEAKSFCDWLSKKEGRSYRLPTDAEWSAAAGDAKYPWGNTWPPPQMAGNFADQTLHDVYPQESHILADYRDGAAYTSPVRKCSPNALGFFDLSGNVLQYCEDEYRASLNPPEFLAKHGELRNDQGHGGYQVHVVRGSSWMAADLLETVVRRGFSSEYRSALYGFRCVLVEDGAFAATAPSSTAIPPPVANTPSTAETWRDLLHGPEKVQPGNDARLDNKSLHFQRHGMVRANAPAPNFAVRMSATYDPRSTPRLLVKESHDGHYAILVGEGKFVRVVRSDRSGYDLKLAEFPLANALTAGRTYRLETQVLDGKLTVALDDHVLGSAMDSNFGDGGIAVELREDISQEITELTARPLVAGTTGLSLSVPEEVWRNPLIGPDRLGTRRYGIDIDEKGIHFKQPGVLRHAAAGAEIKTRMVTTFRPGGALVELLMCGSDSAYPTDLACRTSLRDGNTIVVSQGGAMNPPPLGTFLLSTPIAPGEKYILEERFSGGELSVAINRHPVGAVFDTTLSSGFIGIALTGGSGVEVDTFEYAVTDAAGKAWQPASKEPPRNWGKVSGKTLPARSSECGPEHVDLTNYYNGDLAWTIDSIPLPTGLQTFKGTRFDVRGIVQIANKDLKLISDAFPEAVKGIAVGQKARRIHFLHSASFGTGLPQGKEIGDYVIHLQSGVEARVPIVLGKDVTDWANDFGATEETKGHLAWSSNPPGKLARIYEAFWENPQPESVVSTIDFVSKMGEAAPFLVAITVDPATGQSPSTDTAKTGSSSKSAEAAATPAPANDGQAVVTKWLAQTDAQYQDAYLREVMKPYENSMGQLKQIYLSAIARELNVASAGAKLDDAVALRAERDRMLAGQGVPADDSDTTVASLKALRTDYRGRAGKLEETRVAGAKAHFATYDKILASNQATLTQRQRLDEALLLKAKREDVAKKWLGEDKTTSPAPMAAKEAAPAAATLEPKRAVRMSERDAVEWLLSVGGSLTVIQNGQEVRVTDAKALPREGQNYVAAQLVKDDLKQPVADEEFDRLAALKTLKVIQLRNFFVSKQAFTFLSQFSELRELNFGGCHFEDGFIECVGGCEKLSRLLINTSQSPLQDLDKLAKLKYLTYIDLSKSKVDDAGLKQIAKLAHLEVLKLTDTQITDAAVPSIIEIESLRELHIQGTAVTPVGLKPLARMRRLEFLGYFKDGMNDYAGSVRQVAQIFPAMQKLWLAGRVGAESIKPLKEFRELALLGCVANADALPEIAKLPRIDALILNDSTVGDADLEPLAHMKSLRSLQLNHTMISDAGLDILKKDKALRILSVKDCKPGVSEAAAAAFEKEVPGCKVTR